MNTTVIAIPKPDHTGKILVAALLMAVCTLSALTAAIPSPKDYSYPIDYVVTEINSGDTSWVLTSAALVLLMTPGVSFFYGGMVDHKNVLSTMYQSFVAMGFISLLWVWIGFSLSFGDSSQSNGIIGHPKTYFMFNGVGAAPHPNPGVAPTIPLSTYAMFQLMFAIITPTLISGSLAERVNFNSWVLFICAWHLLVFCPLAHMAFHPDGAFRRWGCLDFAGGTVVEMASGYAALAGAIFIGPRKVVANNHANIPYVLLGTSFFWFGWLGFNAGSAVSAGALASQAFATTNTGAAAGMVTWILMDKIMGRLPSVVGACNGVVVGLVALTPSCGFVTVGGGMCIGCIATLICYSAGLFFQELSGIDDSLDVFTIHGLGGTVGFLCTGIFCSLGANPYGADGLIYGQGMTLAKHLAVCCAIIPLIMVVTYAIMFVCDLVIPMRVSEEDEHRGLDLSCHNESTTSTHKLHRPVLDMSGPRTTYPEIGLVDLPHQVLNPPRDLPWVMSPLCHLCHPQL